MSWDTELLGSTRLGGTDYLKVSNNYLLPLAYLGPIYYYAILKQKNVF